MYKVGRSDKLRKENSSSKYTLNSEDGVAQEQFVMAKFKFMVIHDAKLVYNLEETNVFHVPYVH